MARLRRRLLALALLAALPGCQIYEDYLPWNLHFQRDMKTGRTILTKDSNTSWCRKPTPLRLAYAPLTIGEPSPVPEPGRPPAPPRHARPAGVSPLLSSPAVAMATRRATGRKAGEVVRADYGVFKVCGEIDGRPVYRRLLPSEAVAEELGATQPE